MFQLTCPACKTQQKTPFVRLGAVAMCPSCSHRYPVKPEYFAKLAPESPIAPEIVDRLLGIVPLPQQPGANAPSGVMPPTQPKSTVIAPQQAPTPIASQQPTPIKPTQPAPAAAARPATSAPTATAPAAPRPATVAPTQPPKPAAPAAAAPAAPAATATQAPTEEKPAEAQASEGFFGKLFKRFK